MTTERILARLRDRRPSLIDLSLDRIRAVLNRLGDPQRALPPVMHVAGTNGKGSVIAFAKAVLEAQGLAAHAYTSPHLASFNERIYLGAKGGGGPIEDDDLAAALDACDEAAGDDPITFFEITTCAAFYAFANRPADAVLLEVGLGGRLDATNVIDRPAASVITPIGIDHRDFLGDTIEQIALEKAGIFKPGAPAVSGRQSESANGVLESEARRIGAPLNQFGRQWAVYEEYGRVVFRDHSELFDFTRPKLAGPHQIDNAGLAIAALRAGGFPTTQQAIEAGMRDARWPARMQRLRNGPLIDRAEKNLGGKPEIWLDGAHNPHASYAIARAFADLNDKAALPLVLICAMKETKDAEEFLSAFSGVARAVIAPEAPFEPALPASEIAAAAANAGLAARRAASLEDAIDVACELAPDGPRILIVGSLYLAGAVLAENA